MSGEIIARVEWSKVETAVRYLSVSNLQALNSKSALKAKIYPQTTITQTKDLYAIKISEKSFDARRI